MTRRNPHALWAPCAIGLAVVILAPLVAYACDTPVYEYTIHMWQRDPYRVWYYHDGAEDSADKPANDLLAGGSDRHANVSCLSVDISKLGEVGYQVQRQVYEKHKDRKPPFHVVLTPRGAALTVERLSVDAAKALLDSPKRQTMAKALCSGKQGALILLLGTDDEQNSQAREVIKTVAEESKAEGVEVEVIEVSRDDAAEKWLVEQLLNLEDDLHEFDQPMVFGTFGRAHALEPYLGRGITRENLLELVQFIGGPCSCEIKAASPGMDLLTKLDWEAELENWVSRDPAQLAADTGLGGYTEIMIPATPADEEDPDAPQQSEPAGREPAPAAASPKPRISQPVPKSATPARAPRPPTHTKGPTPPEPAPQPKADPPEHEAKAEPRSGPAQPAAELDQKPGETLAAEQEQEPVSRVPELPEGADALELPDTGPALSRRLGTILGFGLGGGVLFAAVGGTALLLLRREK